MMLSVLFLSQSTHNGTARKLSGKIVCFHILSISLFISLHTLKSELLKAFGPKTDKVTGGWRKLHNEELRDLYSSPSIIRMIKPRRMRWAGHVARMGEKRNAYRLLVGKPEGRRLLARQRRKWVDNNGSWGDRRRWCGLDWSGSG
jgi:hypothetical protein